MKIISCNSNRPLAQEIARLLCLPLTPTNITRFPDGELFAEILENVRGEDVFVIQSTCKPANDNLMELLLVLDVLKRASAQNITAVIPYFGYARQDRKAGPRTPISARLVADLISVSGTSRVLTLDLHADQIQGFWLMISSIVAQHSVMQQTDCLQMGQRKFMLIVLMACYQALQFSLSHTHQRSRTW